MTVLHVQVYIPSSMCKLDDIKMQVISYPTTNPQNRNREHCICTKISIPLFFLFWVVFQIKHRSDLLSLLLYGIVFLLIYTSATFYPCLVIYENMKSCMHTNCFFHVHSSKFIFVFVRSVLFCQNVQLCAFFKINPLSISSPCSRPPSQQIPYLTSCHRFSSVSLLCLPA